ncbi:MAG: type II secretion system F family protein [Tenericutes bacterium]|nr:type II secretion system F family protein [Mycoplasmatota bacterium]
MAKEKEKKVKTNKKDAKKKNTINKKTTKKPRINPIKFIINEIIVLIKSIGLGIFGLFDILVSFIVSFVSYTYWGMRNIIVFLWKLCFKGVFGELYVMLFSCYSGFIYIFSMIFVDLPMFLYDKCSKVVYKYYKKYKAYQEAQKAKKALATEKALGSKSLTKTLADYITEKYENLSFVKEARAKKEASLVVLTLDPNGVDAVKSATKQTYRYLVRGKDGKLIKGYFPAFSKMDVYSYLTDEGYIVYEIATNWSINFLHADATAFKQKMKIKDLVFWLAQLSTYIRAGIALTEAVKILAKQDKRKKYKPVYESLIYELTMGESFSESLRKQGNVFPALLVNMIKSSELIGNIEDTLDEMADYYQEVEDTKRAVISAMAYPCVVLLFAIGIVIFMLTFIVPRFVGIYESMNAELNVVTVITLKISAFLRTQYVPLITGIIGFIVLYAVLYIKVKAFRTFMQTIFMKLPVVGDILIYKEMSLFARTFATLQKNNVLLTDSIDILAKITNNEIYKSIMNHTINNLIKGEKMSESFKDNWAIPDVAYYMILTGESTGELANMLEKIGDYYQKLEKNSVNMIKTFIEPVLIVFLAVVVGFILIAVVVPMFGIYSTIS